MKKYEGNLEFTQDTKVDFEEITGHLIIRPGIKFDAPKLKNKNDKTAVTTCKAALDISFKKKGLIKVDGILSWVISKRKIAELIVFKVKVVGKLEVSFVVQRADQFSHGKTVKEATESLRYKLSDRDTSRFKKWTLKTKVNVEDAIQAYRTITGACEFGVKSFCESVKVPEKLTVTEIIKLTDGRYGNKQFAEFFKG
jgi:hypothetical protein